ncbi:MAG: phosphate acyltransferase PlsX [Dehalococcoidales bacterium]|nr:phosphate acyltransferase PlsX [Dehalococcoidales bacterium]
MIIAVDAAGGDYAPQEVVKGAAAAVEEYGVEVALVGRRSPLEMLARRYEVEPGLTIIEAAEVIGCNESPVQAIRSKPNSSIVVGTKLVRDGVASAFISAGNTGAVVGAAFMNLARIEGVQRPALCGVFPIDAASTALLIDVGANVDCRPEFLVQFAQLGDFFAKSVLGIESPRVGLLNGSDERIEANLLAKESYELLEKTGLNFIGSVGGQDILMGKADVIVTDGFTGNVVLKTIEGLGDIFQNLMSAEQAFKISTDLRGTALVRYSELACMVERMDYKEYGGACLLGIDGNIIVAHGRSQAKAIKNAIHLAHRAAQTGVVKVIKEGMR